MTSPASARVPLLLFAAALSAGAALAAKKPPADPNAPAALSWSDRTFVGNVRTQLHLQPGGAPPIESLTSSQVSIARIKPLQAKLAALDPTTHPTLKAVAHAEVGNALALRQLDDAAAAEYLEAIALDPKLAPAWDNLGALLRREHELKLSQKALDAVLELEPRNGLAWFNQALLHEDEGDLELADAAYKKALLYQPSLWLPSQNPLVIGNRRAQLALLTSPEGASGGLTLDPNPAIVP